MRFAFSIPSEVYSGGELRTSQKQQSIGGQSQHSERSVTERLLFCTVSQIIMEQDEKVWSVNIRSGTAATMHLSVDGKSESCMKLLCAAFSVSL